MIGLTKEKREELIAKCKEIAEISDKRGFIGVAEENCRLIHLVALASLTAEPVLYAVDSDVEDKIYTALCNENEDGSYPLFTAPSVPEIRIPADKNYLEPLTQYGLGVDDGYKRCLAEIKRLNGLGE